MSHTNQTPNYHLPQFIGTDKPAWLVDFNQAMSDIDTKMKANETAGATAEADAQSALSGVTALNSQVSSIQTSVTALETQAPLDEAQIETNRQNISTNAQNIVGIDNRLGHVDISGIGANITDAIKNVNDAQPVDMTGATAGTAGTHGLVPAPSAGDEDKFLKGNGTWSNALAGWTLAGSVDSASQSGSNSQRTTILTVPNTATDILLQIVIGSNVIVSTLGLGTDDSIRSFAYRVESNAITDYILATYTKSTGELLHMWVSGTEYSGTSAKLYYR